VQTRFVLPYDDNNDGEIDRQERVGLKFGDELTTSLFATWNKKLGTLRSSPVLYLSARLNNVFDDRDFTGRENYGYYRESAAYNLSARIKF
ncbi:MAG: hypothetical protein VXZ83_01690, partial [Verrucomicrobiota bacterium]|nr:hypothetical protein [Verrucomicrobiota bacterium]